MPALFFGNKTQKHALAGRQPIPSRGEWVSLARTWKHVLHLRGWNVELRIAVCGTLQAFIYDEYVAVSRGVGKLADDIFTLRHALD